MIKNYVLFLVLILFNLNINAQAEASLPNLTQEFASDFASTQSTLHAAAGWTAVSGATWKENGQKVENGSNYDRLTVKRKGMRHQWSTPINAAVGDILTLKIYFKFNGTTFDTGTASNNGDIFTFGLKSVLDSSTSMSSPTTSNGEVYILNIADADTNGEKHLNVRYKTNDATAAYCTSNCSWATFTIKYFIGNNMANSRIFAQLDNNGTKSGWLEQEWDAQDLYDAITDATEETSAYTYFYSGNSLTTTMSSNQIYIDKYEFWTDADANGDTDTGLVMINSNTTWTGASSTGSTPKSAADRVFIFDRTDVYFSGGYNRTWGYLWINEGAEMEYKPTAARSLTLTDLDVEGKFEATTELNDLSVTNFNLKSGGVFTVGTVDDVTLTNADVESEATLTISNANDIASTDTAIKGDLIIGTANDLTFTDLDVDGTVSVSTANKIDLDHLDFGTGATFDLTENSLREGFVVVSPNSSGTPETNEFDSNFTLNGVPSLLTTAPAGLLLRKTSYLNRYYTPVDVDPSNTTAASNWERYDTATEEWVDEADFPSNTTEGYYQNSNLIYTSLAYGTGSLSGDADEHFQFNDIHILDGKKMVINNLMVTANNVYIEDTNDASSIVIYSGTLKTTGSISGNLQYNKYLDTERWYAVSSPVVGQDIDALISSEDLLTGSGTNVALATYENDGSQYTTDPSITTGWWNYFQSGQTNSGSFNDGKGYITQLANPASDQQLTFTGTVNNGSVSIPITTNTTAFNLVGNPYTASIAINSKADATNNVLTVNSAVLDEQTAWFWNGNSSDGATPGYVTINQNPSQDPKISMPTQAFFVKSAAGGGNLSFTTAMQTSSQGSFNRQTEFSKIDLSMSADGQTSATEIVYFEGATTGWDNGYDSTNFSSAAFQLFTDHVDNAWNDNLSIQSLPPNNYDNMVVPVGVNASAGQSIAISIGTTNWPEGVNVYLEDTDDNSFTLLDANTAFTTLLDSDENGIGRFYIHTTSNSLGDGDLTLTDVVIYTPSKDILRILGLSSGPANVQMFDLMGKQVLNTSFNGQSVNDVKLPNLNTGVYLVTLVSDEGTVNKKLMIQ